MGLLERWARFAHRRRWYVVIAWVVALAGLMAVSQVYGSSYSNSFKLPGSEAIAGQDLLQARFPQRSGDSTDIVFKATGGIDTPETRQKIDSLLGALKPIPQVVSVESPFDQPGAISKDGTIARATLHWSAQSRQLDLANIKQVIKATEAASVPGFQVEPGGQAIEKAEGMAFSSEMFGLIAAVFILFIAFGSAIAVGLPIGAALFGLGTGFPMLAILSHLIPVPEFGPQFSAMIGIGVGIDYSLLVVTRFREGLHTGHSVEDSIVIALTTSGRSVIFAGIVVAIAFLGLYAMGIPFIAGLGTAGALVVLGSVLVALTLMPAMLSISGRHIDRWRVPLFHSTEGVDTSSTWYRFSRFIQAHSVATLVPGAAFLILLAAPVLSMHLGFSDFGNNATNLHTRKAFDLLKEGFGPGFNGPLLVVADLQNGGADRVGALQAAITQTPGIVEVTQPILNPAKDTAIFTVFPATSQQDPATSDLVKKLRNEVVPGVTNGSGAKVYVGGQTAAAVDIGARISQRLPFLFVGVIGLSFLLLMAVFRSVLVAVKAAIMNLLSIGASYGVLVAVFQWGWGAKLLGIEKGPVETFLPMMLFAILFGLSMDYEVFLISRIREEYVKTGDNATAVTNGLAATARVITAAGAIMVTVFLSFALGDNRVIKEFGIGLATAILVDATLVRMVLVPATMELLGEANWWLPSWLDRLLPNLNVEGSGDGRKPLPGGSPAGGK
jgi:RND superfamily putative drug exporter